MGWGEVFGLGNWCGDMVVLEGATEKEKKCVISESSRVALDLENDVASAVCSSLRIRSGYVVVCLVINGGNLEVVTMVAIYIVDGTAILSVYPPVLG